MHYLNRSFIVTLALTVCAIETFAQAPAKPGSKQQVETSWLKHQTDWFSIEHPSDWELNTSGLAGSEFFLFAPLVSTEDVFRENVNLLVQDLTGMGLDLNSYTELSESQVKTAFSNSKILLSERKKGTLGEYHRLIYVGKQGDLDLEFEQHYLIKGQYAYVLTLTCEETQFDPYQKTGERILDSFRFK